MKKSKASAVIYLIFFFTVFLAFCAFAVDGTIIFTNRAKLQNMVEATALAAASEFTQFAPTVTTADAATITADAKQTFQALNGNPGNPLGKTFQGNINNILTIQVNTTAKQISISAEALSPTYFLGFLGVSSVKLEARAAAVCEELPVSSHYNNVNWITANAAYHTDIISQDLNLNDTAVLLPLGDTPSASIDKGLNIVNFALLDTTDDKPLSLGPGGYITIRLPAPIIDKPGPDLFVNEIKSIEGYMVFVGIDNDPADPYMQHDKPGAGISWKNISCSGISKNNDGANSLGAYQLTPGSTTLPDPQYKVYADGGAYFDIGSTCNNTTGGITMAKYLRIVDDNDESAFAKTTLGTGTGNYYQTMMYGEASTPTAGADIDSIKILNHVRLIHPDSFVP